MYYRSCCRDADRTGRMVQAFEATGELESLHKPIYRKDGQELTLADKLASSGRRDGRSAESHVFERIAGKS